MFYLKKINEDKKLIKTFAFILIISDAFLTRINFCNKSVVVSTVQLGGLFLNFKTTLGNAEG